MVPIDKGGGHTKDNLWVIPRKLNRSKGNKMPSLEEWLRFTFHRHRSSRAGK